MSNSYKFFGSNHPEAVPQTVLDRRIEQQDDRDQKNKTTRFILGSAAVAAALAMLGKEAVDYNQAHPTSRNVPADIAKSHQ
jgi:hypothetical protein